MQTMQKVRNRYNSSIAVLNFLVLWVRRPLSIGAIAPSSRSLAEAMARKVNFDQPGYVVELGGGTGSITRALIEGVANPRDVVVIEKEESLCDLLSRRFPEVRVIHGDARDLGNLLETARIGPVKAIVSGLPLLSMPRRMRLQIVGQSFAVLTRGGVFIQFTYGLTSPILRSIAEEIGIVGRRSGWVLRNLPPASLWLYRRDGPDRNLIGAPMAS